MAKLQTYETVYYKDWTDNDKIYPAKVIHCKYKYVIVDVLVVENGNTWERWEVDIEDCEPTKDFKIIRPAGGWLGEMISYKEKNSQNA
tara:strand:- start:184 stop:447 length:264 start_codon:yes stop_codon:yes gene_type:complete